MKWNGLERFSERYIKWAQVAYTRQCGNVFLWGKKQCQKEGNWDTKNISVSLCGKFKNQGKFGQKSVYTQSERALLRKVNWKEEKNNFIPNLNLKLAHWKSPIPKEFYVLIYELWCSGEYTANQNPFLNTVKGEIFNIATHSSSKWLLLLSLLYPLYWVQYLMNSEGESINVDWLVEQ